MSNYAQQIAVLRGHLEEVHQAVHTAHSYHLADDLARQYKNVGGTHRPSNLTKRLESAVERLEGYLAQIDDEPISEE